MGAVIRTFCNGLSITQYVEICFNALNSESEAISLKCYIRNDIAHLINMICRWKCFQASGQKLLKEFFVRCVRLLIQARSLHNFTQILAHILTIAYSQTENTAEHSLNFVFQLLEGKIFNEESLETNFTLFNTYNDILEEEEVEELNEIDTTNSNFQLLLFNINDNSMRAASEKQKRTMSKINAYCLPEFGKKLIKLCSTFPIWSNVMVDVFFCPNITASSAPVESDFNNLKNRILKNESKPMKVDRFDIINKYYLKV